MGSARQTLNSLTQSFAELSPRERIMVAALAATFVFLVFGVLYYFISDGLDRRERRNGEYRRAVTLLDRHADELRAARLADARTDARIQDAVPKLQGHLDKIAEKTEVDVKEFKQLKDKYLGKKKRYLEKSMRLRIYGVGIDALSKFLDAIEGGNHLVLVTQLDIETRTGQPELLDVDMVVSTYKIAEKKGEKKKGKKKKGKSREPRRPARGGSSSSRRRS
jgi:hypothetical protein